MQRREFIKLTAAAGVFSALPLWSRSVFAAGRPALPVPDLLTADARNRITLTIQTGKRSLVRIRRPPGVITEICWGRR